MSNYDLNLHKMTSFCKYDPTRANSVFWARALNLPLPYAYVFQEIPANEDDGSSVEKSSEVSTNVSSGELADVTDGKSEAIYHLSLGLIIFEIQKGFCRCFYVLSQFINVAIKTNNTAFYNQAGRLME